MLELSHDASSDEDEGFEGDGEDGDEPNVHDHAARVSWLLNRYAPNGATSGHPVAYAMRIDARYPASDQTARLSALGWPTGPPSAGALVQLLLAHSKASLAADVANREHHHEPIFKRNQRAYDRSMAKIENAEPTKGFDVDDPDTWPDDDDEYDSDAAAA